MKKTVYAGNTAIGGGNPVSVQSMTNTKTRNIEATSAQILSLAEAGCDIVRIAVQNEEDCKAFSKLPKPVPLVADIQYDLKNAVYALENGADKIRINPQNSSDTLLKKVCDCANAHNAPIRIGINYGSVREELKNRYSPPEALVKAAVEAAEKTEKAGCDNLVLSVKSSDVAVTVKSYRMLDSLSPYPLHLGVTEAGDLLSSAIKSSAALGTLLMDGIGDTIRYSITGDPLKEAEAALTLLKALGLRRGMEIIACPTCSRTTVNLEKLLSDVKSALSFLKDKPVKVAVMGCAVNGIGEAKDADFGVAASNGKGVIFADGKQLKIVDESKIVSELAGLGRLYTGKK